MTREEAIEVYHGLLNQKIKEAFEVFAPELRENEDERIRKDLIKYLESDRDCQPCQDVSFYDSSIAWLEKQKERNMDEWLEYGKRCYEKGKADAEQKEQKPANKPKFKVGDWIIFAENHNSVYQVERIDKYRYYLRHYLGGTLSAHFDNELVRQWTIQDAKPGDVLVCIGKYGQEIGIVKEYVGKYGGCDKCFETYCFVDWEGIFRTGEYMGSKEIHPATKEQRNTLMKAMADNGYTFDFENKNLNKKEQKPITINQDEKKFLADEITAFLCNYDKEFDGEDPVPSEVAEHFYLLGKQTQKPVEWSGTDNIGWDEAFVCVTRAEKAAKNEEELQNAVTAKKWLKEIKFKYCVHPVKQEWSEEDERMLSRCIKSVECSKQFADSETYKAAKDVEMNWLKSLPGRFNLQPKQEWSEEDEKQIAQIERIVKNAGCAKMLQEKIHNWLKSLRPSWKPSEEQMEELNKVRTLNPGLDALYQQLKNM